MTHLITTSDYGYDISGTFSNFSASSTFDNSSLFAATNNQYYEQSNWKTISNTTDQTNGSPIRESLDERINNLLKINRCGLPYQESTCFIQKIPKLSDESSHSKRISQQKFDDEEAIRATPPSPFLSASEYFKSYYLTKEIDMVEDSFEKNHSSNKIDDDSDDRMSLSSLSSNERIDDSLNGINSNNSDHNFNTRHQSSNFTSSNLMYPEFMYQSFVSNDPSSKNFFQVPSSFSTISFSLNNNRKNPSLNELSRLSRQDLIKELKSTSIKICISDFREILYKDIKKKLAENLAFKLFDKWWENNEKNSKSTTATDDFEGDKMSFRKAEINIPFLNNPLFENSIQNRNGNFSAIKSVENDTNRDFRAAKILPSFKRIRHKSSTYISFGDKLSDISNEENDVHCDHRRFQSRSPKRYKKRPSISSESVSSQDSYSSISSSQSRSSTSSLTSLPQASTSFESDSQETSDHSSSEAKSDSESNPDSFSESHSRSQSELESESESQYQSISESESESESDRSIHEISNSKSEYGSDLESESLQQTKNVLDSLPAQNESESEADSIVSKRSIVSNHSVKSIEQSTIPNEKQNLETNLRLRNELNDRDTDSTLTADETVEELKKESEKQKYSSSSKTGILENCFMNIWIFIVKLPLKFSQLKKTCFRSLLHCFQTMIIFPPQSNALMRQKY